MNLEGINSEILGALTPIEKDAVYKILSELSTDGSSKLYNEMLDEDYEEIPVDIDTFIEDDLYIGKITQQGTTIYPYWREKLRQIFDPNHNYNECLAGDTLIPLMNGTKKTIKELVEDIHKGIKNYTYSFDLRTNRYVPGKIINGAVIGKKHIYRVTLDNGKFIDCTDNHKFLTRDKHYVMVKNLKIGDSIMPFNFYIDNQGYEHLLHPQKDGSVIDESTHRISMRYKRGEFKGVVHHRDFNKRNNYPENLLKLTWINHRRYHAKLGIKHLRDWESSLTEDEKKIKFHNRTVKGLKTRYSNPENIKKCSKHMKIRNLNGLSKYASQCLWNNEEKAELCKQKQRERLIKYNTESHPHLLNISKEQLLSALESNTNINSVINELRISRGGFYSLCNKYSINYSDYIVSDRYLSATLNQYNKIYSEYGYISDDLISELKSSGKIYKTLPKFTTVLKSFKSENDLLESIINYNHKIISIKYLRTDFVYDIEIEEYHNFALDCGIIVKNCIFTGAIG